MTSQRTILVVEDDQAIRDSLVTIMEIEGFKTYSAGNGQKALEILKMKAGEVSLILLDLMMPVMNGYQFREEQLRNSDYADIPTVVLSAERSFEHKVQHLAFKHILKKPVDLDELLKVVHSF